MHKACLQNVDGVPHLVHPAVSACRCGVWMPTLMGPGWLPDLLSLSWSSLKSWVGTMGLAPAAGRCCTPWAASRARQRTEPPASSSRGTALCCLPGRRQSGGAVQSASARDMGPQCYSQQACKPFSESTLLDLPSRAKSARWRLNLGSDSWTGCSCWPRDGRVRSEAEAKQHFKRRRKRKREKMSKATIEPAENGGRAAEAVEEERSSATDELAHPSRSSPCVDGKRFAS